MASSIGAIVEIVKKLSRDHKKCSVLENFCQHDYTIITRLTAVNVSLSV